MSRVLQRPRAEPPRARLRRWMRSTEGLVVGSNYCRDEDLRAIADSTGEEPGPVVDHERRPAGRAGGPDCEAEGWLWPDLIATEMRSRPGYGEPER